MKEIKVMENEVNSGKTVVSQDIQGGKAKVEMPTIITPKTTVDVSNINKGVNDKGKVSNAGIEFIKANKGILGMISISIIVSISSLVYLYLFVFISPDTPQQIIKPNGSYVESSITTTPDLMTSLNTPGVPKTEVSPINGTLYTKEEYSKLLNRRPVAVMINNHVQGRPQSGLDSADIVYEAVTESGITRYMAIYWSSGPNKVGPIRSARQYYLEWLSPFDSIYIHDGCASTKDPRTNACGNIYTYEIKDITTQGAWRSNDRFAPHNEYSSVLNAWEIGKSKDWDKFPDKTESLQFKRDANISQRGKKTKVRIIYRTDMLNGGLYNTEWVYNRNSNMYTHRIGGTTDIDNESRKPITAKTVIIEEVELKDAFDGAGRVIITTIGQGNAKILMDGKIINAKWRKSSRTDRTRYYDSAGKEIEINRGKIWINIVPKNQGKFDIIEQ